MRKTKEVSFRGPLAGQSRLSPGSNISCFSDIGLKRKRPTTLKTPFSILCHLLPTFNVGLDLLSLFFSSIIHFFPTAFLWHVAARKSTFVSYTFSSLPVKFELPLFPSSSGYSAPPIPFLSSGPINRSWAPSSKQSKGPSFRPPRERETVGQLTFPGFPPPPFVSFPLCSFRVGTEERPLLPPSFSVYGIWKGGRKQEGSE